MHRGMAAQLLQSAREPGCRFGPAARHRRALRAGTQALGKATGAALLFGAKRPKSASLLLAQRSFFMENQRLCQCHKW